MPGEPWFKPVNVLGEHIFDHIRADRFLLDLVGFLEGARQIVFQLQRLGIASLLAPGDLADPRQRPRPAAGRAFAQTSTCLRQISIHDHHHLAQRAAARLQRLQPGIDRLIPALYLKGISSGDFTEALNAILADKAAGLSATNILRQKAGWEEEYKTWCQPDPSTKSYVYWWADDIYFNVRLDEERSCVLVLIGALEVEPGTL